MGARRDLIAYRVGDMTDGKPKGRAAEVVVRVDGKT